ncbi:hypothetical protein U1Q18_011324 [Sarracenia purpurea var. burkii]
MSLADCAKVTTDATCAACASLADCARLADCVDASAQLSCGLDHGGGCVAIGCCYLSYQMLRAASLAACVVLLPWLFVDYCMLFVPNLCYYSPHFPCWYLATTD